MVYSRKASVDCLIRVYNIFKKNKILTRKNVSTLANISTEKSDRVVSALCYLKLIKKFYYKGKSGTFYKII